MILLIVPLFLILMILVIFYVFDLHLSIKSTSKTVSNADSQKDLDPSSSSSLSSLIDDLSGANIFSDVPNEFETDVNTDLSTPDVSSDVSGVNEVTDSTYNDLLDDSTTPPVTSSGYNMEDITTMLNQVAVNTNVGVNMSDPSGVDATTQQDITTRVSELENIINTYLNSHTHNISNKNNIYSQADNIKLCDLSANPQCDSYESCAIMCSDDPNCAGWVHDISNAYRYTCNIDDVYVQTISGGCGGLGLTSGTNCNDSLSSGEWASVAKEDWKSHTYGTTDPPITNFSV